jgi:hypothetical protein
MAGRKKWWQWIPQIELKNIGMMARILARTQQLMNPRAYMAEYRVPAEQEALQVHDAAPLA